MKPIGKKEIKWSKHGFYRDALQLCLSLKNFVHLKVSAHPRSSDILSKLGHGEGKYGLHKG